MKLVGTAYGEVYPRERGEMEAQRSFDPLERGGKEEQLVGCCVPPLHSSVGPSLSRETVAHHPSS